MRNELLKLHPFRGQRLGLHRNSLAQSHIFPEPMSPKENILCGLLTKFDRQNLLLFRWQFTKLKANSAIALR